jgi:peptidoglycan hydrolase CwlO-like protein
MPELSRWPLIRDMLVFQVKLALDALRDLFLSPVSIICGLVDILMGNSLSKGYFHKLMNFGHKTDSWLNLFGNHNQDDESLNATFSEKYKADKNVDQLFLQVESLLKEQHDKGGLTASAKATIDRYLKKIANNKKPSE